ncbi:unknown [Prevotella sp. CAG:487]|nr:unknown [Prevotella sp. CAG:487]
MKSFFRLAPLVTFQSCSFIMLFLTVNIHIETTKNKDTAVITVFLFFITNDAHLVDNIYLQFPFRSYLFA